jgi:hypothetical protein
MEFPLQPGLLNDIIANQILKNCPTRAATRQANARQTIKFYPLPMKDAEWHRHPCGPGSLPPARRYSAALQPTPRLEPRLPERRWLAVFLQIKQPMKKSRDYFKFQHWLIVGKN